MFCDGHNILVSFCKELFLKRTICGETEYDKERKYSINTIREILFLCLTPNVLEAFIAKEK